MFIKFITMMALVLFISTPVRGSAVMEVEVEEIPFFGLYLVALPDGSFDYSISGNDAAQSHITSLTKALDNYFNDDLWGAHNSILEATHGLNIQELSQAAFITHVFILHANLQLKKMLTNKNKLFILNERATELRRLGDFDQLLHLDNEINKIKQLGYDSFVKAISEFTGASILVEQLGYHTNESVISIMKGRIFFGLETIHYENKNWMQAAIVFDLALKQYLTTTQKEKALVMGAKSFLMIGEKAAALTYIDEANAMQTPGMPIDDTLIFLNSLIHTREIPADDPSLPAYLYREIYTPEELADSMIVY